MYRHLVKSCFGRHVGIYVSRIDGHYPAAKKVIVEHVKEQLILMKDLEKLAEEILRKSHDCQSHTRQGPT